MTSIVRFVPDDAHNSLDRRPNADAGVGLLVADTITTLDVPTIAAWLASTTPGQPTPKPSSAATTYRRNEVTLLPPVDRDTEIWAAGVTYKRSRQARMEESEDRSIYARVYDAVRPELFYKSVGWRAVGDGEYVSIRPDSTLNVPEPELALLVTSAGVIAGYTICNDMSSRDIEGANPLYLPQAKTYLGACAIGPGIVPAVEVSNPNGLRIDITVRRNNRTVWSDTGSTEALHRTFDELITHLFTADAFPHGLVLSTGTCLAPPLDVTLCDNDQIVIEIDGIGQLTNTVATGPDPFRCLTDPNAHGSQHNRPRPHDFVTAGSDTTA